MIRLCVPGALPYRDVVLRVVASACKLVRLQGSATQEASQAGEAELDTKVVSAVSEAFNNIAIHGYGDGTPADVEMQIELGPEHITVRLSDTGKSFDFFAVSNPDLAELPESHMGLFIVRSFMDEVSYTPGQAGAPNVLTLTKRC